MKLDDLVTAAYSYAEDYLEFQVVDEDGRDLEVVQVDLDSGSVRLRVVRDD